MSGVAARSVRTWIFQAQPKSFDIDGFLATRPTEFLWLARQRAAAILPGDQVFLWRAIGGMEREKSGVIAEARVIAGAMSMLEDPAALPFWRDPTQTANKQLRVRLRLLRVASPGEVLQRDWLRADPHLRELSIFWLANSTNFVVSPEHAARLNALWDKPAFEREVERLTLLPYDDLAALANQHPPADSEKPAVRIRQTSDYVRRPEVAAFGRARAGFRCEVPVCAHPVFTGNNGQPYCEVHHIVPLAEDGDDTADNVACVCPAHHREAHYGQKAKEIGGALVMLRRLNKL